MTDDADAIRSVLAGRQGDVVIPVFAQPRASRSRVVGLHDGMIKVQLAAAPVDGAANKELVALLARALGVPRSAVEVASGASGRRKRVVVRGVTPDAAARALCDLQSL